MTLRQLTDSGAPGQGMSAAAADDATDLVTIARSLYITGAGNLKITCGDNSVVTITVPANFVLPVVVKRVWATGLTATGIFAIH